MFGITVLFFMLSVCSRNICALNNGAFDEDSLKQKSEAVRSEVPEDNGRSGGSFPYHDWPGTLWPNRIVPYVIDYSSFTPTQLQILNELIAGFMRATTCVKWVPRTNEKDYVKITHSKTNCYSYVGCLMRGEQKLGLANRCFIGDERSGILHEMFHSLGWQGHSYSSYTRVTREGAVNRPLDQSNPMTEYEIQSILNDWAEEMRELNHLYCGWPY